MRNIKFITLVLFLSGCFSSAPPSMPEFKSETEKMCARSCQATYSNCVAPCSIGAPINRGSCSGNCNSILADCYRTCS